MNATLDTARPRYVDPAPIGIGRAHAKAILFGEHAVVYGAPALAVPVTNLQAKVHATQSPRTTIESELFTGLIGDSPTRLTPVATAIEATLAYLRTMGVDTGGVDLRIDSKIPADRGLGSSAAVAAAISEAVAGAHNITLDTNARFGIAQEAERTAHGTPSGLDARTVLASHPIQFQQGIVRPLAIGHDLHLVLADSGVRGSTATAVAGVRAMYDTDLGTAGRVISHLSTLADTGHDALRNGDLPLLGQAMSQAHEDLTHLGVSVPELDNLVATAHAGGALGAKLTGGGLGGCVLALARDEEHAQELMSQLAGAGAPSAWQVHVPRS